MPKLQETSKTSPFFTSINNFVFKKKTGDTTWQESESYLFSSVCLEVVDVTSKNENQNENSPTNNLEKLNY